VAAAVISPGNPNGVTPRLNGQGDPSFRSERGSAETMTLVPEEIQIPIEADVHVVAARQAGRTLARQLGFTAGEATIVATAISELARNIVTHATRGMIIVKPAENGDRPGVIITARDEGRGIADVRQAMQDGYSTSGGLGIGLPGVKRLMDDFEIVSEVGRGTSVTVKKWKR